MILFELIGEALRNLLRHKLRSLLTALGIIFGIASVLAMVSTGEGARQAILAQIGELGIRNIIVNTKEPPASSEGNENNEKIRIFGLKFKDHEKIEETLPIIEAALPVHDVDEWIWFRGRRLETKVRGVTPKYFDTLNLDPGIGRVLTPVDGERRRRVCVVRAKLLQEAKYVGDPLQLELKIGSQFFRVVGVLDDLEFQSPNRAALGIDDRSLEVYVPFETVIDRFGIIHGGRAQSGKKQVELHQIVCTVPHVDQVLTAARSVRSILEHGHPQKDYEITVPLELLESQQQTQEVFNLVLRIIAGISLLVGGIGILNIMLASITERTREIGIRRALGATGWDITLQFLIETVTLASFGGALGVGLGWVMAQVLEQSTEWVVVITPWAIGLSLLISSLTGVIFGLYPAIRAARMNPIKALRHD